MAFASLIRLPDTKNTDDLCREYKSSERAPVEFCTPEDINITVFNLPTATDASYFRLVILDYSVVPCLRMEIMG